MAESEELRQVLDELINALNDPNRSNLGWLATDIQDQLRLAEDEARAVWQADNPHADVEPETVITSSERLEIALRVIHHHLVSVPRMWAYVQRFWRQRQANVILLDQVRGTRVDLPQGLADHSADTALGVISRLIDELRANYGLEMHKHTWLSARRGTHEGE